MQRSSIQAAVVISMCTACALGRPGSEANRTRFERTVGTGGAQDVMEVSLRMLHQFNYEIFKQTPPPAMYVETRWRSRAPYDDEQMLGIVEAQTRLIVRGSRHGGTPLGPLYRVDLTIENHVRTDGQIDWTTQTATDEYRKYADRLTEDFKRELEIGVRRIGT